MQPTSEWLNQPGGLAERLTLMRKAAGLTQEALAALLDWPRSKVVKLENGRQMPVPSDLTQWAEALGRQDAVPDLLPLLEEAQAVHRQWRHKIRTGHAAVQVEFDTLVRNGTVIRNFQTFLIPGLVQTPDYSRYRMLEAVRLHGFDPDKVEEAVGARMRRQGSGANFSVMSVLAELDQTQAELQNEFPGWRIWYVYRPGVVTWAAQREPVLNTRSAEDLRAAIRKILARNDRNDS